MENEIVEGENENKTFGKIGATPIVLIWKVLLSTYRWSIWKFGLPRFLYIVFKSEVQKKEEEEKGKRDSHTKKKHQNTQA